VIETGVAATTAVLACCLRVWQLFTRGKHGFGASGSPLIKSPAYRVLFLLVLIGVLLAGVLPEAAVVLPALDAVGLDIVTIWVASELRHYWASVAQLIGIPTSAAVYLRVPARVVRRCGDILRTNPALWPYACMWPAIWLRTLMGKMPLAHA
jgi:hypothetical protein